jgi:hypothetical protein
LKSHTHISRLQLPLFILWMPVVGLTLFKNKLRYGVWLSLFIWALGLPWLLNNAGRPLIPPDSNHIISQLAASGDLYFLRAPELLPISEEIADAIIENGCQEVGTAFKIFEYSFWRKLQEKGFEGTLRHVLVENESRQLEDTGRLPCAVLASKELGELSGYRLLEIGDVRLYLQQQ